MKFIISGTEYGTASLSKLTLWDTIELQKQTGMNMDAFGARIEAMEQAGEPDMEVIGILVWLARRRAGEALTLEAACDFPLDELETILEDGDEPVDPQVA